MASSGGYAVTVSLVDLASKEIDKINRSLAEMRAPADRLTRSFGKLADNTGITKLSTGMRDLAGSSLQAFENIGRMVPQIGALTGAASIAGLAKLVTGFSGFSLRMQNTATRAGTSAAALTNLGNAARLAGANAEDVAPAYTALADNLFNWAAGRGSSESIAALTKMNISLRDSAGNITSTDSAFETMQDYLSKVTNQTQRFRLETDAGGQAMANLDPALRMGSAGFKRLRDEAFKLNGVTDQQVKDGAQFELQMRRLSIVTEGFGVTIAAALLPVLQPVVNDMSKWVQANKDWIASDIAGFVNNTIPKVKAVGEGINTVVQYMGGWQTVSETLFALWLGAKGVSLIARIAEFVALLNNPIIRVALLAYAAFKGAVKTGTETAQAGDMGLTPANMDEFGHPLGYKDRQGNFFTNEQAATMSAHPMLLGDGEGGGAANDDKPPAPGVPTMRIGPRAEMTPGMRALLDTIEKPESGGQADVIFGGQHFSDFSQHPNVHVPIPAGMPYAGQTSSAAGVLQMIKPTWDAAQKALNLPDFTRPNQERAGIYTAQQAYRSRTHRDLTEDLDSNDPKVIEGIADALSGQWGSLPGGLRAQGGAAGFMRRREAARGASMSVADGTGGGQATMPSTTVKGTANVNVKLENFPPGTQTTATTVGDLFQGPPKIERTMVGAGGG